MDSGQWIVDSGQWTVNSRQWILDSGQWTVDSGPVLTFADITLVPAGQGADTGAGGAIGICGTPRAGEGAGAGVGKG